MTFLKPKAVLMARLCLNPSGILPLGSREAHLLWSCLLKCIPFFPLAAYCVCPPSLVSLPVSPGSCSELVAGDIWQYLETPFGCHNWGKCVCYWHLLDGSQDADQRPSMPRAAARGKELSSQNVNSAQAEKPCSSRLTVAAV